MKASCMAEALANLKAAALRGEPNLLPYYRDCRSASGSYSLKPANPLRVMAPINGNTVGELRLTVTED